MLLIDRYGEQDRFYVRLFHPGQFTDWSHELHGARRGGSDGRVYLLHGEEWVASANEPRVQTWLCVPTAERGYQILGRMLTAEKKRPGSDPGVARGAEGKSAGTARPHSLYAWLAERDALATQA